jgi:hypothetical protein
MGGSAHVSPNTRAEANCTSITSSSGCWTFTSRFSPADDFALPCPAASRYRSAMNNKKEPQPTAITEEVLFGKPLQGSCSGNSRVALFVDLPFYNTVVLASQQGLKVAFNCRVAHYSAYLNISQSKAIICCRIDCQLGCDSVRWQRCNTAEDVQKT